VAVHRQVTLKRVWPPGGVLVAVDGDDAMEASTGKTITFNDKSQHTLLFTCTEDLCEPLQVTVAAGDADESVPAVLHIKPARLTVVGDPGKSYVLVEMALPLPPNVAVDVPMRARGETFHVRELVTNREEPVPLVAGKAKRVNFIDDP
jgi:hypothetical protein